MQPDLALVFGILLAGLSLVGILSAFSDRRAPRASALTVLVAGGLILYALRTQPGGYQLSDVPEAFIRVIAQLL